jgi:hypothetical protein
MASPMNETWWSTFLTQHGRDSEEEQAFLGYLTTQEIPPGSDPGVLTDAYAAFHQYMLGSLARASADPGPERSGPVIESVPQSRTANPGKDTLLTAATHPQALEVAKAQAAVADAPEPHGGAPDAPEPHAASSRSGRSTGPAPRPQTE